ncbi:hypothetical protein Tco_1384976 [Tanacetum coccineum]
MLKYQGVTDGDDFVHPKFSTHDEEERQDEEDKEEEGSDLRVQTPSHFESTDDKAYDEVTHGDNGEDEELDEEETNEEEEVNELYRDVNVNLERRDTEMTDALQTNVQGFISYMLNPNPDTGIDSILNLNTESTSLFEDRVKDLEDDFSEFKQTKRFAEVVSSIPVLLIIQDENEDFINELGENMRKIIKEQVKVQVKEQVTKILPRIEKSVNEQLEADVLIRLSNKAKTFHAVAANLSELELKKILIDKMKNNKSIDKSVPQKNLYKALVNAYESDKDILATYGHTITLKRRRDDEDDNEEPSVRSNWGSKRRRAGKEPESTSAPKDKTSKSTYKSKEGSKSHQKSTGQYAQSEEPIHIKPAKPPTPDRDWNKTLPTAHGPIQPWITNLDRKEDPHESFNELMDTPLDFSACVLNRVKVDTLTSELLAGPTFKLMKDWNNPEGQQYPHNLRKPLPLIPNSRGHRVIPFDHFINNDLALSSGVLSRTYATLVTKTKATDYGHIKGIEDLVPNTIWINRESARDVYSRHRILVITKLKIVEWHNYNHLDWITALRNDDKLYTFKEGDYNILRLKDIEDMLLLLVQGKLANLNVEERLALGVSLRMFTRSIILRRCVEYLQLGVESYQKKLNLIRPDMYRSYLKHKERAGAMIQAIDQQLRNRRIIRSLENFCWELEASTT